MDNIRILLVEDNPADALLINEALFSVADFSHGLVQAETLAEAVTLAGYQQFDIVLLDLGLPDAIGIATFERFHSDIPNLPVLVLTALDDVKVGLLAIHEGAQDYLIKKNITTSMLSRAIRYAIERHRVSAALAASEERFQLAVNGAAAGLWDWNFKTGEMYFAPRFKEIMGYEIHELADESRTYEDAIHPSDVKRVEKVLDAHLENKDPFDVEYRLLTKSGKYRWVQSRGQALWDKTGKAYRMVGWIMDISERKHAEAQLQQSRERLRLLAARLQTIREEERTRISREVHDELGQMISALKIDLRWLNTQLSESLTTDKMYFMNKRILEAEQLADSTLKAVQRIAIELRPGVLDHLGLAGAIRDESRRFEVRTGVPIAVKVSVEIKGLNPDISTAFFRIFQEILTNVARHAQATKVKVSLYMEDGSLVLEVRDNGIGLPAGAVNLNSSLGLLSMRERAAAHGGEVLFDSEMDKGTRVIVRIPFHLC